MTTETKSLPGVKIRGNPPYRLEMSGDMLSRINAGMLYQILSEAGTHFPRQAVSVDAVTITEHDHSGGITLVIEDFEVVRVVNWGFHVSPSEIGLHVKVGVTPNALSEMMVRLHRAQYPAIEKCWREKP